MRQQVAPKVGLSYSINDIGVIGRAMHVLLWSRASQALLPIFL
jgi:hypothetical protein